MERVNDCQISAKKKVSSCQRDRRVRTQQFSRSYNNSSCGVNLTPYRRVILGELL